MFLKHSTKNGIYQQSISHFLQISPFLASLALATSWTWWRFIRDNGRVDAARRRCWDNEEQTAVGLCGNCHEFTIIYQGFWECLKGIGFGFDIFWRLFLLGVPPLPSKTTFVECIWEVFRVFHGTSQCCQDARRPQAGRRNAAPRSGGCPDSRKLSLHNLGLAAKNLWSTLRTWVRGSSHVHSSSDMYIFVYVVHCCMTYGWYRVNCVRLEPVVSKTTSCFCHV